MTLTPNNNSILASLAGNTTGQRRRLEQRRQRRAQQIAHRRPLTHRQDNVDLNNNTVAPSPVLDRMAILKAFGMPALTSVASDRHLKYEKPTGPNQRRFSKSTELKHEFSRLRETVPTTAGTNASDLTVINEAISLICDLEAQLIQKLKCQNISTLIGA